MTADHVAQPSGPIPPRRRHRSAASHDLVVRHRCGLSVANIYYAQPLLDVMAKDLDITPSAIGVVVTLTQIGYALGLIFVVPLGDLIDRRRLVLAQTLLSAGALDLVATAKTSVMLFAGMVATGVLAVVVQVRRRRGARGRSG